MENCLFVFVPFILKVSTNVQPVMEATDHFAASQVSITILDENDNSPVFDMTSDTSVSIPENTAMGRKVAVVLAKDSDAGLNGLVRLYFSHTSDSEFETARHF